MAKTRYHPLPSDRALVPSSKVFTIRGMESKKLISHAKSLIAGSYGNAAHIQVA